MLGLDEMAILIIIVTIELHLPAKKWTNWPTGVKMLAWQDPVTRDPPTYLGFHSRSHGLPQVARLHEDLFKPPHHRSHSHVYFATANMVIPSRPNTKSP